MKPENNSPDNNEKVLTSIHGMYTLPYTQECGSEVEVLTVKNFLNTLAEIALAIASRKDQEVKR
jgi:hypothetical protein